MGKNQMFKAIQRAKHVAAMDGSLLETEDGTVDASFHTPEWHAARMATLQHSRMSWDEFKQKAKEEAFSKSKIQDEEERVMLEYRAQLAADREKILKKKTEPRAHKKKKSEKEQHRSKKSHRTSRHDKERRIKKGKKKKRPSVERERHGSMSLSESSPIRLSEYLKS